MKTVTTVFSILLALLTPFQHQGWNGVVVLKSTREDVERRLGSPTKPGGSQYTSKDAIVNVEYSTGPCKPGTTQGWNVPEGTVTGLSVYPRVSPRLSDLKIDVLKFTKVRDPHMPGEYFHLVDYQEGLTIVLSGGVVKRFEYWPSLRKNLSCAEVNKKREGRPQ